MYDSPYYQIRKVDGSRHQVYAQCLSLFAKLFLDSKSIFFSVENFDYYLLTISVANIRVLDVLAKNRPKKEDHHKADPSGTDPSLMSTIESESALSAQRVIGFFSKEKVSWDNYNLACITVFPPFQKRGLGRLLISYSYYLSKKARLIGTPERPLSEHGAASYLSYWCSVIADYILERRKDLGQEPNSVSIQDIAQDTYIWQPDVLQALQAMGALDRRLDQDPATAGTTASHELQFVILADKVAKWVENRKGKTQGPVLIEGYCLVRRRYRVSKS